VVADDGRDRYDTIPRTLSREHHPDYRSVFLETYRAMMTFADTHPANDNFCRCWPSVETIAARAGHSRRTTFEALAWLKEKDYILVEQRGRKTSLYTLVLRRDRFLATCKTAGRAAAIEEYQDWLAGQQEEARGRVAAETHTRHDDEAPRPTRAGASMCEPAHLSTSDVRPGALDRCAPSHGAARRTQNDLQLKSEERDPGNEHSGLQPEPPSPSLSQNNKDGTDPDREEIKAMVATLSRAKRMPG
jgi:hypothetical protein